MFGNVRLKGWHCTHKGFTKIIDFVLVIYQLTCNREMGKAAKISNLSMNFYIEQTYQDVGIYFGNPVDRTCSDVSNSPLFNRNITS